MSDALCTTRPGILAAGDVLLGPASVVQAVAQGNAEARRPQMPVLPVEERQGHFHEVELGMDEHTVQEECKRCLRCDLEWLEEMGLALEPMAEQECNQRTSTSSGRVRPGDGHGRAVEEV